MFDIGFPELVLVAIVGLLVIGPERLPEALRTLGLWFGRMRRSFTAVKAEIEKEIGMDEVKRQLHNEAIMDEMKRIESEVRNTAGSAKKSLDTSMNSIGSSLESARVSTSVPAADPASAHQDAGAVETALPAVENPTPVQTDNQPEQSDFESAPANPQPSGTPKANNG